jgi:molecular chaperone IbpA
MKEDNTMSKQDKETLDGLFSTLEEILRHPRVLGLSPIFNDLRTFVSQDLEKYPPHNVIKHGETQWLVEVAVAGFSRDELSVVVHDDRLTITGNSELVEKATNKYLHRGVARRPFKLSFKLGDHCKVGEASYQSGMLLIPVDLMVTEPKPSRSIQITEYDSSPSHDERDLHGPDGLGPKDMDLDNDRFDADVEEHLAEIAERDHR